MRLFVLEERYLTPQKWSTVYLDTVLVFLISGSVQHIIANTDILGNNSGELESYTGEHCDSIMACM